MQTVQEDSLIILDTVSEAYARFDSEFRLTFANHAAQTLLGKTRADLLGKNLSDVYPTDLVMLQENCRCAMAEHRTVTVEHYSEPWRRWYVIKAIPDSSGGIVVQFSDITDRKLMEASLRKSNEKLRKVFQSSPVPMCLVDIDKSACFLEVNDAFERIPG
jgi:PAS domain S-box-containing protein